MSKRLILVPLILLLLGTSSLAVAPFDNDLDIGAPRGIGSVVDQGYVWKSDHLAQQYLVTAGGSDIWGTSDQFHYAYKTMTGDVRITCSYDWVAAGNDWAKVECMLRGSTAANSIFFAEAGRKGASYANDYGGVQYRMTTGGSAGGVDLWKPTGTAGPKAIAVQRVTVGGLPWVEGLVDWGSGWVSVSRQLSFALPSEILVGVAVTSHDNNHLAQAKVYDVRYDTKPQLVSALTFAKVPATADQKSCPVQTPGFAIRTIKAVFTTGWGRAEMDKLLDLGCTGPFCTAAGMPVPGTEAGKSISKYVNLHDSADRGMFNAANGYPDETFPGIDAYQSPTTDPAAGDDDNNFATEVKACIKLTKGLHIIGVNDDDGTIVTIGGVEIGRSAEWKGTSNTDFVFEVEADGYYALRARHIGGTGGEALELHEILANGTRILLGDVAKGGSPVYVPEPATIALLGLGGLALVRTRRKS